MAALPHYVREEHRELVSRIEVLRTVADSLGTSPLESIREDVGQSSLPCSLVATLSFCGMGGRNETEHNNYAQPLLDGVEAPKPEQTELTNCLVLSRPAYTDTGNKHEWTCTVHAQPSIFQPETDTVFLASATRDLAVKAQRKSLKPGIGWCLRGLPAHRP